MPRYMLDTDTSSLIMNYKDVNVFDRLQRVGTSDVCISIISKCEMLFGIEKSPEPTSIRQPLTTTFDTSRSSTSPAMRPCTMPRSEPLSGVVEI